MRWAGPFPLSPASPHGDEERVSCGRYTCTFLFPHHLLTRGGFFLSMSVTEVLHPRMGMWLWCHTQRPTFKQHATRRATFSYPRTPVSRSETCEVLHFSLVGIYYWIFVFLMPYSQTTRDGKSNPFLFPTAIFQEWNAWEFCVFFSLDTCP